MKVRLSILLIFIIFINSGCYNYKDIEDVVFCTSMIIDVAENGDVILYMRALKGVKSLEETEVSGQIISFKEQDKTIFDCIRNATLESNAKLNFSQNKVLIFTDQSAEEGISTYLDILERDQELNLRTILIHYSGEIKELVEIELIEEKNIGIYLIDTCLNGEEKSGKARTAYLNNILNESQRTSYAYTLPAFEIEEVYSQSKLRITETSVFKDGKLVGSLTQNETVWYNLLTNNIGSTVVSINHFNDTEKQIVLEVLKASVKTESQFIDNNFIVKKTININTTIGESGDSLYLDEMTLSLIKEQAEENIAKECMNVIDKLQGMNTDLLGVTPLYERSYREGSEIIFANTQFVLDINIEIEGSSDIKNAL